MPDVNAVLERMRKFTRRVRLGEWTGYSGEPIRAVVNLGIGGSTLGPRMAHAALAPFHHGGPQVHYVANVDGDDLDECLAGLEPASTLFIVASKTFTTRETMANARVAREWISDAAGNEAVVADLGVLRVHELCRGTGSVAGIHSGRQSGCRWPWPWA